MERLEKGLTYSKQRKYNLASPVRRIHNWEWIERQKFHHVRKDLIDIEIGEEVVFNDTYKKQQIVGVVQDHVWLANGKLRYVIDINNYNKSINPNYLSRWWLESPRILPRIRIKRKPLTRAVLFEKRKPIIQFSFS